MAEFVMKDMVKKAGLENKFVIRSVATSTEELGNPVYPPARAELKKHGIGCDGKYSVQLARGDYEKYDLFICMDSANVRNALRIFGTDPDGKVKKLMEYTDRGGDVADPWYTGDFGITCRDITDGCEGLLAELLGR